MRYRHLGKTGLKVSEIGLGTHVNFGGMRTDDECEAVLTACYECGVNMIDTAEAYNAGKAESLIGSVMKKLGWSRDSMVLCSKVIFKDREAKPTQRGLSRKHIFDAVEGSLNRLQTGYLDIYLCHHEDPSTPVEETCRAMSDLVQQGKVRYWGLSNPFPYAFVPEAMSILKQVGGYLPTVKMLGWNIACPQSDTKVMEMYGDLGMGVLANVVLGGGLLTGKYTDGVPKNSRRDKLPSPKQANKNHTQVGNRNVVVFERLKKARIAEKLDLSPARLACAWALKHPYISSLALGASTPEQVRENAKASEDTDKLTDEIMEEIEKLRCPEEG